MLFSQISIFLFLMPLLPPAQSGDEVEIGIVEKLGDRLPADITLTDEAGRPTALKDLLDKPTVLALVYYECPGLCGPLMDGIRTLVDKAAEIDLVPGKEYTILTVSFDPRENADLASLKKANYFTALKTRIQPDGWRFLTGDADNIKRLADAVGFQYRKVDDKSFNHTAALAVLAPGGKITRYLHGTTFLPFDLKMSLIEAAQGTVGASVTRGVGPRLLLYCFSYDPQGRRYAFNILKIVGTASLVFVIGIAGFLIYHGRKRATTKPSPGTQTPSQGK